MTAAPRRFKLGKKHALRDSRTLAAHDFAGRLRPPMTADWHRRVKHWPLYDNDRLGTCAVASYAHLVLCQTANADGPARKLEIFKAAVVDAYLEQSPADEGLVLLEALKTFRSQGIGGVRIGAFAAVDYQHTGRLLQAIYQFGGVYAGFALPEAIWDMDQNWYAPAAAEQLVDDWAAGSGGGHAVYIGGYSSIDGLLYGASWGQPIAISLAFARAYLDECYVTVGESWSDDVGETPSGVNLRELLAAADHLGGNG
jgi:hypothetical protein